MAFMFSWHVAGGEASCSDISSSPYVSATCPSSAYDQCIVVVENSPFAHCSDFCESRGSACLDGWDSHEGSCNGWPQGCSGQNCGDDCICMCASDPYEYIGSEGYCQAEDGSRLSNLHTNNMMNLQDCEDACSGQSGCVGYAHSTDVFGGSCVLWWVDMATRDAVCTLQLLPVNADGCLSGSTGCSSTPASCGGGWNKETRFESENCNSHCSV